MQPPEHPDVLKYINQTHSFTVNINNDPQQTTQQEFKRVYRGLTILCYLINKCEQKFCLPSFIGYIKFSIVFLCIRWRVLSFDNLCVRKSVRIRSVRVWPLVTATNLGLVEFVGVWVYIKFTFMFSAVTKATYKKVLVLCESVR